MKYKKKSLKNSKTNINDGITALLSIEKLLENKIKSNQKKVIEEQESFSNFGYFSSEETFNALERIINACPSDNSYSRKSLNDDTLKRIADKLYVAFVGPSLPSNKRTWREALKTLGNNGQGTFGDLCEVNKYFNIAKSSNQYRDDSFAEWIRDDTDQRTINEFYNVFIKLYRNNGEVPEKSQDSKLSSSENRKVLDDNAPVNAVYPIENVGDVKNFQYWMDINYPNWSLPKYPNGVSKSRDYGIYGPLTKAALTDHGAEYSAYIGKTENENNKDKNSIESNQNASNTTKKMADTNLKNTPTPNSTNNSGDNPDKTEDFFMANMRNNNLRDGKLVDVNYRDYKESYLKSGASVGDPDSDSNYYFFNDFTWIKVKTVNGAKKIVASGEYDFGKNEMNDLSGLSEQRIIKTNQTMEPKETVSNDVVKTFRENFNYLGIPTLPSTSLPDPNMVKGIYDAIIQFLNEGWQSKYFYFFKQGLKALQAIDKTNFNFDTEKIMGEGMATTDQPISGGYNIKVNAPDGTILFMNYPSKEINLLNDPILSRESFEKMPLKNLINALPPSTPSGALAYKWNRVTQEGGEDVSGSSIGEINENNCMSGLLSWYGVALMNEPIDKKTNTNRVKEFLQACNNNCMFTNKDENFIGRLTKNKLQKSAQRMIEELRSPRLKEYAISFENVEEKCRRLGKEYKANKNPKTNDIDDSKSLIQRENHSSLKKIVREAILNKKKKTLKEANLVKRRLFMVEENNGNLNGHDNLNNIIGSLMKESNFLIKEGIDEKVITEGLSDWLKSFAKASGGGLFDAFQERLAKMVLTSLGMNPNSYFGSLLITGFANLDLNNVGKIIAGDCKVIVKVISETLLEAIVKNKQNNTQNANGIIGDVFRNIIFDAIFKDKIEILAKIEDAISKPICNAFQTVRTKLVGDTQNLDSNLEPSFD